MLTWKWTKRPLGDLERPKKSRRRLFCTMLGPKSKSRGAQERPQIGPKRQKPTATIDKIVFVLFLLLLRVQRIWDRCGVDSGSIRWSIWGDRGSILNRFVCLSVSVCLSLSVCHPDIQESTTNKRGLAVCAKRLNNFE